MKKILINVTGDLVINKDLHESVISKEVEEQFRKADFNIVNLECPITKSSNNKRIIKTGPHLRGNENSIINIIKKLKVSGVTLANNHILDYGPEGVIDTIEFCNRYDVEYVGAGINKYEAAKALRIVIKGIKLSFINITENEWSINDFDKPSANPVDLIENIKSIREEKNKCDFLILIIHGGNEYRNLPSPRIQKLYRFFVDEGADLVISHHTHCISGFENYKNSSIYYGLGNFLFTKDKPIEDWYYGIILEIEISKSLKCEVKFTKMIRNSFKLELLSGEEYNEQFLKFKSYSNIITNDKLMDEEWNNYIISKQKIYRDLWSPISAVKNRYIRGFMKKIGITFLNTYIAKYYLNLMRCESHQDLSKEVLNKYINSK